MILTETQLQAMANAKEEKEAHGEFESEHPGYCGAQDTFYVGTLKGVGRIYQQTFIDTYSKVGFAKLYDRKTPITAADLLNDRVLPFFESHGIRVLRVLTDRGTEYCGNPERQEYELYLAIEDIDQTLRRRRVRRRTESASASTRRSWTSSTGCSSGRRSTARSRNSRKTWMRLWRSTTRSAPTRDAGATGRPRGSVRISV